MAPELLVVYFQIVYGAKGLALPMVPTQHFQPQCLIRSRIQPQSAAAHAAIPSMLLRNSRF